MIFWDSIQWQSLPVVYQRENPALAGITAKAKLLQQPLLSGIPVFAANNPGDESASQQKKPGNSGLYKACNRCISILSVLPAQ
jgi:hypothetical protein